MGKKEEVRRGRYGPSYLPLLRGKEKKKRKKGVKRKKRKGKEEKERSGEPTSGLPFLFLFISKERAQPEVERGEEEKKRKKRKKKKKNGRWLSFLIPFIKETTSSHKKRGGRRKSKKSKKKEEVRTAICFAFILPQGKIMTVDTGKGEKKKKREKGV